MTTKRTVEEWGRLAAGKRGVVAGEAYAVAMRIFIGHAKGHAEDAHVAHVAAEIQARVPGAVPVLSRDEWQRSFALSGSWDAWVRDVGAGCDWQGCPTFDGYVVMTEQIGRATAQIVSYALAAGRDVLYWPRGAHAPVPVRAIEAVPGEDSWLCGWRIIP